MLADVDLCWPRRIQLAVNLNSCWTIREVLTNQLLVTDHRQEKNADSEQTGPIIFNANCKIESDLDRRRV